MKKVSILLFAIVAFSSCQESAIEQLAAIKKPCVVYSKHSATTWYDQNELTIKDANGKLIEIDGEYKIQLLDKFAVGDTIN